MYDNVIRPTKEGEQLRCWRCGRIVFENKKNGHIGCLNTKCHGYLWGAKRVDEKFLVPFKK